MKRSLQNSDFPATTTDTEDRIQQLEGRLKQLEDEIAILKIIQIAICAQPPLQQNWQNWQRTINE